MAVTNTPAASTPNSSAEQQVVLTEQEVREKRLALINEALSRRATNIEDESDTPSAAPTRSEYIESSSVPNESQVFTTSLKFLNEGGHTADQYFNALSPLHSLVSTLSEDQIKRLCFALLSKAGSRDIDIHLVFAKAQLALLPSMEDKVDDSVLGMIRNQALQMRLGDPLADSELMQLGYEIALECYKADFDLDMEVYLLKEMRSSQFCSIADRGNDLIKERLICCRSEEGDYDTLTYQRIFEVASEVASFDVQESEIKFMSDFISQKLNVLNWKYLSGRTYQENAADAKSVLTFIEFYQSIILSLPIEQRMLQQETILKMRNFRGENLAAMADGASFVRKVNQAGQSLVESLGYQRFFTPSLW